MNIESIKQKVAKAISKVPTEIVLKRYVSVDDGMGGNTVEDTPTTISTFDALLDNSKNNFLNAQLSDSGVTIRNKTPVLIVVYSSDFTPLKDDFFLVGGITYNINNVTNILNLNIYWECSLEVVT